jgi:hypothetical protein
MYVVVEQVPNTPRDEVVVYDTVVGFARIHSALEAFLNGGEDELTFSADGQCPEAPDAQPLSALRFRKAGGPLLTWRAPDRALEVAGPPNLLARYARKFIFGPDGGHHHPEQAFELSELHSDSEMIVLETMDDPERDS